MSTWTPQQIRAGRVLVFVAILMIFGALKAAHTAGNGPFGLDGGYYVQIARHVMAGDGVKTSVSLYDEGLKHLPARSPRIYPLWPLLLGYAGRALGLFRAAGLLPKLFYCLDLVLLYALGNRLLFRIAGRQRFFVRWPLFTAGHVLVLFFGANETFFEATNYPYTEALSFFLAFATLLAADGIAEDRSVRWSIAAGLLAGLAFLARTQMIILCAGLVLAMAVIAAGNRDLRKQAAAAVAVCGAIVMYWYFAIYNIRLETAGIAPFELWVTAHDPLTFLAERARGLLASLDPFGPYSSFHLFGPAAALPMVAAGVWLAGRPWRNITWPAASQILPMVTLLSGLGFVASLTMYHGTFFLPWLFGYRHGLPVVLLVFLSIVYLAGSSRWLVAGTALVVAVSISMGFVGITAFLTVPRGPSLTPAEAQFVRWANEQSPVPTILTTHAQELAAQTTANYHWSLCSQPATKTEELLARLPIDYVLVYERERNCAYVANMEQFLRGSVVFGESPNRILLLVRQPAIPKPM